MWKQIWSLFSVYPLILSQKQTLIICTTWTEAEWLDLVMIEMMGDSNTSRNAVDSITSDVINSSQQECPLFTKVWVLALKVNALLPSPSFLPSFHRPDICISHLYGISRGSSMCTGSGEGYSVGSQSLPRGSIYHQSPVSPPELFSIISNSYKCCLGLEGPPPFQTSHLSKNDEKKMGTKHWGRLLNVEQC